LSTGAAGEEESVADEDCGEAVTGLAGRESESDVDDIAGVKVGEASGSATTTAFLISGISLVLSGTFFPG
jgi:hypothetical protein